MGENNVKQFNKPELDCKIYLLPKETNYTVKVDIGASLSHAPG